MRGYWFGSIVVSSLMALSACTGQPLDTDADTDTDAESGSGGGGAGSGGASSGGGGAGIEAPQGVLDLPATPFDYADIELPAHYVASLARGFDNTPAGNPITNDGATLGRVLFYDTTLSANGKVACASCHVQKDGFADPRQLSVGFAGELTARNSMSLAEARYYRNGRFFWDERAPTLEAQVLLPIQNSVEMGLTLDELVARVEERGYYAPLFEGAFGDAKVTSGRISRALAQFVRSIVSYRSGFDQGMIATGDIGAPFPAFTPQENQGKGLFLGKAGCAACHLDNGPPPPGAPPGAPVPRVNQAVFFIDIATNNGLPIEAGEDDDGVGGVSGNAIDARRFKSPSLRNVARTAPYMHDGRFETLEEVVEHYDSGVVASPTLDARLRLPGSTEPRKLGLTPGEKAALVAFLGTLSDPALLADPRYSSPFVAK